MMQSSDTIAAVKVATLQAPLPVPVVFGNRVMRHRESAICGVSVEDGWIAPLPQEPGFGMTIDPDWPRAQNPHDPDDLTGDL